MPSNPRDLKSAPDMVAIRLQLSEAERDRLRVIAAKSPHKTMAIWCREIIRQAMKDADRA